MEFRNYSWIRVWEFVAIPPGHCGFWLDNPIESTDRLSEMQSAENDRTLRQLDYGRHCRGRPPTINKLFKSTIVSILIPLFHRQIEIRAPFNGRFLSGTAAWCHLAAALGTR